MNTMTKNTPLSREDFTSTVERLTAAAKAYYDGDGDLLMSDDEYDELVDAVTQTRAIHPDWDDQGVTTAVAAGQSAGGTLIHPTPMLSMSKSKNIEDVESFIAGLPAGVDVVVEPKLDGVAIRAEYSDGELVLLATRGDGHTGENVPLSVLPSISGLPQTIGLPGKIELRGEIFMTEKDFEYSNTARVGYGSKGFANPRNAVSGTLRRETVKYDARMSFAAYDASGGVLEASDDYLIRMRTVGKHNVMTAMSMLNTHTPQGGKRIGLEPTRSVKEVLARIASLGEVRANLDYGIDGAVVKVVSYAARADLGVGTRAPKWATAFKYPPQEATGVLADVEVAVGRTGKMSLVGVLEHPVQLDGSLVSRATLHNVDYVVQENLGIGSRVLVRKQGDIIPRITSALGAQPAGVTVWEPPSVCPNCGEPWNKDQVIWRCESPGCSLAAQLTYWCSKSAMDVDIAGAAVCEAIAEQGLAANVADLYTLTAEDLAALPTGTTTSTGKPRLLGKANAKKIVDGLEASKTQPLNRVITGLGIPLTGRSVGRWLANHFKSMDALRAADVETLSNIEMLGPIKAQTIVDGLARLAPVIDRLAEYGVTMSAPDTVPAGGADLSGKTYVVSGSVPGYTRTTISERIEALGGKASSSVSAKTTALVTSETDTSKAKKAAQLGIPVIAPEDFAAMIAP